MTDEIIRLNKVISVAEKELQALSALNHLHTGDYKVYHQYKIDDLEAKIEWMHDLLQKAIMDHLNVDADHLDDGSIM